MDKADEHDACDEVRKWRRCGQQKPCGFAAALGRRQRVAHNSTGPTSVSIDFTTQKGSWGPAGGSIESTGARSVRQARRLGNTRRSSNTFSSCLSCSKASPRGVWRPSVMQFYSGPPIHFLSGVDRDKLGKGDRRVGRHAPAEVASSPFPSGAPTSNRARGPGWHDGASTSIPASCASRRSRPSSS